MILTIFLWSPLIFISEYLKRRDDDLNLVTLFCNLYQFIAWFASSCVVIQGRLSRDLCHFVKWTKSFDVMK